MLMLGIAWSTITVIQGLGSIDLLLVLVVVVTSIVVLVARGHFRVRMVPEMAGRLPTVLSSVAVGGCVGLMALLVVGRPAPSLAATAGLMGSVATGALVAHVGGMALVRSQWKRGRLRSSALIYGTDKLAWELAVEIGVRPDFGIDVAGFVANTRAVRPDLPGPVFDASLDIVGVLHRVGADRLIIGPNVGSADRQAIHSARRAASAGVPVFVVPRFFEMGLGMGVFAPDRARGYPLVRLQRAAHPHVSIRLKRAFDLAASLTVLVAGAPVIVGIAALVKLTSSGPVLFSQERVGQHGASIRIYKFRSMTTSDTGDLEWTADARVTPVGRWLRRLNLDELPQLWSVVKGDMSLVGPRPERPLFVERFGQTIPEYHERHRMPVGLTGLAQIAGLRGDTSIAERIKYDNLYIDQWSFGVDIQILAQTITAIVRQRSSTRHVIELEEALEEVVEAEGETAVLSLRQSVTPIARTAG